jgi:hypothetical protein
MRRAEAGPHRLQHLCARAAAALAAPPPLPLLPAEGTAPLWSSRRRPLLLPPLAPPPLTSLAPPSAISACGLRAPV